MKIINYNFPDELFNQFSRLFSEKEYQSAISNAIANYLEDMQDITLAEERLAKGGPVRGLEDIKRELGLEN